MIVKELESGLADIGIPCRVFTVILKEFTLLEAGEASQHTDVLVELVNVA